MKFGVVVVVAACALVFSVVTSTSQSAAAGKRFESSEYAQALLFGRGPAAEQLYGDDTVADADLQGAGIDPDEYDADASEFAAEVLDTAGMEATFAEEMSSGNPARVEAELSSFGDAATEVLEDRYGAEEVEHAMNGRGGACAPWACVWGVYMVAGLHTVAAGTHFVVAASAVFAAAAVVWKVGLWTDSDRSAGAVISRDQFIADLANTWAAR